MLQSGSRVESKVKTVRHNMCDQKPPKLCQDCGVGLSSKAATRCTKCAVKRRSERYKTGEIGNSRRKPCIRCNCIILNRVGKTGLCQICLNHKRSCKKKGIPFDLSPIESHVRKYDDQRRFGGRGRGKQKSNRCPDCGAKITTKECIGCAIEQRQKRKLEVMRATQRN